jgi:hypothetical protein
VPDAGSRPGPPRGRAAGGGVGLRAWTTYLHGIQSSPRHARRRTRVHWGRAAFLVATLVATGVAIAMVVAPGAGPHATRGAPARADAHADRRVAPTTSSTTTTVPPTTTTTVDPGTLPQTDQLPEAGTPQFDAEMDALWNGIVANSVQAAMPAFFPESAYVQVKQIADPQDDYTDRLVSEYGLDIGAANALLGPDPAAAKLLGVDVDESYAHWVPPGSCYNGIGYYEVANSRVVYEENGQTQSFGIASMISWRGVWYVVHLGAVVRDTEAGVVDDPESGTGAPEYSSTC